MSDALTCQGLRETANLVHQTARCERGVVREGLMSDVDKVEHGESRRQHDTQGDRLVVEKLDETEPRAAPGATLARLELVCDRLDDGDPEPALPEILRARPAARDVEAGTVVGHLDHEPIRLEVVRDLDDSLAPFDVPVSHGVRAGLRDGELQVAERLLTQRPQAGEPAQREPDEGEVLPPRATRQPYAAPVRDGERRPPSRRPPLGTLRFAPWPCF